MAGSNRLTVKQVAEWRARIAEAQFDLCALCGGSFTAKNPPVLDHDHLSGTIRGVLHRGCNSMLGKLENNRLRYLLRDDVRFSRFLGQVLQYLWKDYGPNRPRYPTHRNPEERAALAKKRAAAKRKIA